MREAMARAAVGDDVYGDDPTVKRLEALTAERLAGDCGIFTADQVEEALGTPVGSALVGSADFSKRARRFKQLFGGGFRQAGIIATCGP